MDVELNHADPSWCKPLCTKISNKTQKKVAFCSLVTVNTFLSSEEKHGINSKDFEHQSQKQKVIARCKNIAPAVNTDGNVCIERRTQQRIAIAAVISYQRRLRERATGVAPSFELTHLLSHLSLKLSKRAKSIALETARQTFLEVYPFPACSSDTIPTAHIISDFPEIKKKKKRGHPGSIDYNLSLKRRRSVHPV
mmetsp:Transcript_21776/g.35409  ORF Transcript_21776/g.35409 Transcript_21776/m.35409 type:complete len:195 (-) Transcript_21776:92-676(-)|eukprot:CAMPEP_0196166668 /NCGR_PEP_ID=MMETSP0911-20130528/2109_1 /TAXON_ID=49265 /ORGANISM="Thalassiosira rotula, Strain GSO102" /LENGTH=194 /DNA_ID=CAMNT_0041432343 /DNA_START=236 /DNA_END=820 /DNA_ORIENTATION=-